MSKSTKTAHSSAKVKAIQLEDERTLRIVATTPTLDRDLEVIDSRSIKVPIRPKGWKYLEDMTADDVPDVPLLIDHNWAVEKQAGSLTSIYLNADGETEAIAKLSTVDNGERVYTLAKEGHLGNAFSIGYSLQNATLEDGTIKNIELLELSAVFKGSNRDARLLEVKGVEKEDMAEATKSEKELEIEALQAKLKELQADDAKEAENEVVVEAEQAEATEDAKTEEVVETAEVEVEEEVVEAEVDETAEVEAVEADTDEKNTKSIEKETTEMAEKDIAVEGIVEKDAMPKQQKSVAVSKKAVRENFVKQMGAIVRGDSNALASFAQAGAEMRGKAVANGANLYVDEVVAADILAAYETVGRVGGLVDRESITAETLKILVETAGVGFQPVALGAEKPTDAPVWTPVTFEPFEWAVIVPWKDGDQKRTTINIYNQIVRYIASEYAKLEDKIVLTYAGGTVGAETRPATGLVPVLIAASRNTPVASYDSDDVVAALGAAYGDIESDGAITLVANRKTWGQLATSLDNQGRPLFNVVGAEVSAGALGSFNVVLSSVLDDGDVVVGNFADYLLVTRGGLGTLFSREAYIDEVINLFTQDASALRADVDITGGAKRVQSFALLEFPGTSS